MKNTKLFSLIIAFIAIIIAVYFRFCGHTPTPECTPPAGLVATVPAFFPDSLHVKWNPVASAVNYHVQVVKTINNTVLKDTITDKTSVKFGGIPVGTKLTVKVSSVCKDGESLPSSTVLMSGDGGIIAAEDDINGIPSIPGQLDRCMIGSCTRSRGTFTVGANGVGAPAITWTKCEDRAVRYYLIHMVDNVPSPRKFVKIINVGEPLEFTPTCGLTPLHTYSFTVYPLSSLCVPLPAPICYGNGTN